MSSSPSKDSQSSMPGGAPASLGVLSYLWPLAVVVPLAGQGAATAEPDGKLVDDKNLGGELRLLWRLDKPLYVNRQGKVVLQVEGDYAHDFAEGLAGVEVENKWGFIDPRGKWVIRPRFDRAGSFSEGLAAIEIGNKWGYVDRSGNVVIQPRFTEAGVFHDGAALVNVGEPPDFYNVPNQRKGFIDRNGDWIVKPKYSGANGFSGGLARVWSATENGLIDRTGRLVLRLPAHQYAGYMSEGLIAVKNDGFCGYMDRHGKWEIPPQFAWGEEFSEGMAAVTLPKKDKSESGVDEVTSDSDTRYGYIDRSGKIVIPPQFAEAGEFHDGLAAVRPKKTGGTYGKGDRWGYIDKVGKMVIPLNYNEAWDFSNGLAWVHRGGRLVDIFMHQPPQWEGGQWLLIDRTGNIIWSEKE